MWWFESYKHSAALRLFKLLFSGRSLLSFIFISHREPGALLLGLILGETEHSERMERLVVPFRDFFGAIFFFGSLNTSFTLLARGEFSIIIVNLALAGGLMAILQPFAALYVLILASASPLLAKESERIYGLFAKLFRRRSKTKAADEEIEEAEE